MYQAQKYREKIIMCLMTAGVTQLQMILAENVSPPHIIEITILPPLVVDKFRF